MDLNFHIESYNKLFHALKEDVKTVDDLIALLREQMQQVVPLFPLGKFELYLVAAKSVLDPRGQNECFPIYESLDGYDESCYEDRVQMDETCAVTFKYYPPKGQKWTEMHKSMFLFMSRQLFLILERVKLVQLLKCITVTDLLTGALNMRGIHEIGGKLLKQGKLNEYTCIFLNIKNFNYINRAVGARRGDMVLREFVRLAQQKLNAEEYFARMGGDNFVLLAKKERAEGLLTQMNNVQITVPYGESMKTFDLRSRVGIYDMQKGQHLGEGINAASAAVHAAKVSGKTDQLRFNDAMLEQALRQKEVSQMFPKALENQEFVVYYQPKVTLEDNCLCGCEALVRWFRDGAMVPPMQFIPVLEWEGSVCKLDFYVLDQVCRDVQEWMAKGIEPVRISVNFSKAHLHNPDLAKKILAVLQKYDVPSRYIEIELTEMSGYENYETLLDFVRTMHESGVSTSIDDFGTGYSSLNLLKDLNVDIIKLDKSFLNNMENRKKNDVIVIKNIIQMVNELDMEVVAEGVETMEQADFLRGMHCCMAQGFLFDRPLPHDDFEKRLNGDHVYSLEKSEV